MTTETTKAVYRLQSGQAEVRTVFQGHVCSRAFSK